MRSHQPWPIAHRPNRALGPTILLTILFALAGCQSQESPSAEVEPLQGSVFEGTSAWCVEGTSQQGQPPPEGKEIACVLPNGDKQGRYTRWHDSGHIAEDGHYEQGKKEGVWTTRWRKSGGMQSEGAYVAGQKQGVWRFFSKRGKVKEEALYDKGQLVEMKKLSHAP